MQNSAVAAVGQRLATLCITLSEDVPRWVLDAEVVPAWLNLSLATAYLSCAKHWLPLFPALEVWRAVGMHMDDCFFDYVEKIDFEVKVSDVIVHETERDIYCTLTRSPQFEREISTARTILSLVFANRCNQYTADLIAGHLPEILALSHARNPLGPVVFMYKRFNQHLWGINCDEDSVDLEDDLKHIVPFNSMFMDALISTRDCFSGAIEQLPLSISNPPWSI
jgi:hypothetical protein